MDEKGNLVVRARSHWIADNQCAEQSAVHVGLNIADMIMEWLHTDGLMARLKNTGLFTVLEFSLLREGEGTEAERCTWKAKYPTQEAIDRKRDEFGDIGFRREVLLQVVPEEGQDVFLEDITYYDDPPFDDGNHLAHGVDLAISTKESADYTAIVSGEVTWPGGNIEIYVLPNPIIRRMTFSETMDTLAMCANQTP